MKHLNRARLEQTEGQILHDADHSQLSWISREVESAEYLAENTQYYKKSGPTMTQKDTELNEQLEKDTD